MKFYIAEGNLGNGAGRKQVEKLIEILRARGWDVDYGVKQNRATDISEFGREEAITDAFSQDFMACLEAMESGASGEE